MMKSALTRHALLFALGIAATPFTSVVAEAQTSCGQIHATCVKRCKADNPTDKACPSDHCDPKLSECRKTGCWQEGRRYGSALHCNLTKR